MGQILDALSWLGLDWDEGPHSQSERADRHREEIARLVAEGQAYEDEGAVRLSVPTEGATVVRDRIRGEVSFENAAIRDFVIARSDGSPLYNLAVAVDDRDMGITHVVRGEDHLSNTPRQLMVMRALGDEEPPEYAHLPLLHGPDGKKLSKRHGAASVQELRDGGYLPAAVRNYLALLGWGYDAETTFFSTGELVEPLLARPRVAQPGGLRRAEAAWMNGRYLRGMEVADLARDAGGAAGERPDSEPAVEVAQEKMQTLADFWPLAGFAVERRPIDERAWRKVMRDGAPPSGCAGRATRSPGLERFEGPARGGGATGRRRGAGRKPAAVFQPIRVALPGRTVSPGIFESVALVGRDEALARIDAALSAPPRLTRRWAAACTTPAPPSIPRWNPCVIEVRVQPRLLVGERS